MNSMTGYGKSIVVKQDRTLTIEMKSVNNRYLDVNSRIPKALSCFEDIIRKTVGNLLSRGSVDVYVNYENRSDNNKELVVDESLAQSYVNISKILSDKYELDNDFSVTKLMDRADVISVVAGEDDNELLKSMVLECITEATNNLIAMRKVEGETIKNDLARLINNIGETVVLVKERAPKVVDEYAEKIQNRVTEILKDIEIDQTRLLNEVAFFADKADINEEIQRLESHIAQFTDSINKDEPLGRKLDFLSQEIGREINTMGSKSNDSILTTYVLKMKNELEKIKEQIRNVE